jgi:hypothetical protein
MTNDTGFEEVITCFIRLALWNEVVCRRNPDSLLASGPPAVPVVF